VNRNIYVFKEDINGVVHCLNKRWRDVVGGDVLPDFVLKVWKIDEATSQVCYVLSRCFYNYKFSNLLCESAHSYRRNHLLLDLRTVMWNLTVPNAI